MPFTTCWSYRKHLDGLRGHLSRARREVGAKLAEIGIEPWVMPRGGFYLWCCLPEGCDAAQMAGVALDDDVVLAPGNVFSLFQTAAGFMRFNVGQMAGPRVFEVLARAIKRATRVVGSR